MWIALKHRFQPAKKLDAIAETWWKKKADSIQHNAPLHLKRAMELAQEKGTLSWLTTRPLKEHNFVLPDKRALHDALALRYMVGPF